MEKFMQPQNVSRRQFLKKSAIVVGATVVACSGITAAGFYRPAIDFPASKSVIGQNQKILVSFASLCGSTAEIAQEVARVLSEKGDLVDLIQARDVSDLSAYKTVVLGSAIRMRKWIPEASEFVSRFQTELATKSTTFFTVCLTLKDDTAENREKVKAYLNPVRAVVQPGKEGFFAGRLNYPRLSFVEGMLMKSMIKAPEGDFRNWDLIRAWAGEIMA
jgi:menaquinone-dependent protoporphyrinogen oxidase